MPPHTLISPHVLLKETSKEAQNLHNLTIKEKLLKFYERNLKLETSPKWINIISITLYHVIAVVMFGMYWFRFTSHYTTLFGLFMGGVAGFGVTAGAHRLWCHRAYKAKLPLRIILMLCFSTAGQNDLHEWVRDHRVHHKYSETNADPHNSKRGFFFSHVGWLMMKKHPQVLEKGRTIDMSDLMQDPVVLFHLKYFMLLKILLCFVIPTLIPVMCWNESWFGAIASQPIVRYVSSLNFTWLVNSLAHISGTKPYDRRIKPVENKLVAFLAMGEGWHNYHHSFPWDYKAAELGHYSLNLTTMWIDLFAKIGWAYDLRQPSPKMVEKLINEHGDGSKRS